MRGNGRRDMHQDPASSAAADSTSAVWLRARARHDASVRRKLARPSIGLDRAAAATNPAPLDARGPRGELKHSAPLEGVAAAPSQEELRALSAPDLATQCKVRLRRRLACGWLPTPRVGAQRLDRALRHMRDAPDAVVAPARSALLFAWQLLVERDPVAAGQLQAATRLWALWVRARVRVGMESRPLCKGWGSASDICVAAAVQAD